MTDGDLPGSPRGFFRGFMWGRRVFFQRSWFAYLLHQSLVRAFNLQEGVLTARVDEIARNFNDLLQETNIPLERHRGIVTSTRQFVRRRGTHGVRYPDFRGALRETFWERLVRWVKDGAESPEGQNLLEMAGFGRGEAAIRLFVTRVYSETFRLLAEPAPNPGQEVIRNEMYKELFRGTSDSAVRRNLRRIQVAVRAIAAGSGTTAVALIAFDQSIQDALGLGALALGIAAATDIVANIDTMRVTQEMIAVRRQAKNWLGMLSLWLTEYIEWESRNIAGGDLRGIERLLFVMTNVTAGRAQMHPVPQGSTVLSGLNLIKENASQAKDADLVNALLAVQGAMLFDPSEMPNAIAQVIELVQVVPDAPGMPTLDQIERRERRELPPGPGDDE